MLKGMTIDVDSPAEADDVAMMMGSLAAGSPFVVSCVERVGDRHRCVFDLKRPELVVGYRSVIDLQRRIDAEFDILRVERHPFELAVMHERVA